MIEVNRSGPSASSSCARSSRPSARRCHRPTGAFWLSHDAWDDVPEAQTSWEPLQPLAEDFRTFLEQVVRPGDPSDDG